MKNIYDKLMKDDNFSTNIYNLDDDTKEQEFISTNVISLNLLLSGRVDGGIPIGKISMVSALSMLGKSLIALSVIKNAQKKGIYCVLIDTERACNKDMVVGMGIDISPEKLVVIQENGIEEIRRCLLNAIEGETKESRRKVLFVIDSWGSMVTSKSVNDAVEGKDVADMTEPKKKNNLANLLLNTKCTVLVLNHTYTNIGGYGDPLAIPGGTKIVYNSECVLLGKSRAKEKSKDDELTGHIISCQSFKSRFAREKMELKYKISHNGGLDVFYGILPDAIEMGVVTSPTQGFYTRPHIKDDEKFREKDIYTTAFWLPIFKQTKFKQLLEDKYMLKSVFDVATNDSMNSLDEINNVVDAKEGAVEEIKEESTEEKTTPRKYTKKSK